LTISLLEQQDIPEAVRVLCVAMRSVPLHVAVFQGQGDEALRELEQMFDTLLHQSPEVVFVAKLDRQIVGVLRMKSCLGRQVSHEEADDEAFEDTASRVSHWHNVWARHDPTEPHWHLGPVAVVPSRQGSGIGTALMRRFCQEVDACKSGAYLETDQLRTVRFYQRFSFQVVAEADIFDVRNTFMWRHPKT